MLGRRRLSGPGARSSVGNQHRAWAVRAPVTGLHAPFAESSLRAEGGSPSGAGHLSRGLSSCSQDRTQLLPHSLLLWRFGADTQHGIVGCRGQPALRSVLAKRCLLSVV